MKRLKYLNWFLIFTLIKSSASFDLYHELQNLDPENYENVSNSSCINDIRLIFSTIGNKTLDSEWAIAMVDSSAKIPNGILNGNFYHFGQFDECLSIVHPDGYFKGQHCMAGVTIDLPIAKEIKQKSFSSPKVLQYSERSDEVSSISLHYGICLPSTCSIEDMTNIFNHFKISNFIEIKEDHCWIDKTIAFSAGSWAVISILIALLVLVVCSTVYELYQIHIAQNDKPNEILKAFSLFSNTVSLFEIQNNTGDISCLHGLRTLTMMWVVLCHTFNFISFYPVMNIIDETVVLNSASYIVIVNGFFSVDTFFFLSGLLVAFVFFRNMSKSGSYDVPLSFLHRYIRLTPSLALVLIFNLTLIEDLTQGPLWASQIVPLVADCRRTWWSTILYVQNYAQPEANCLSQAWYLSCDMQMFWIAPIILYPIYLWPKVGLGFLALLTLGSTALAFGMALRNEYKSSLMVSIGNDQFFYDYLPTHTRIMPWFIGVGLGVAICAIKAGKTKIRLTKGTVILGWLSSTTLCLSVLYGYARFQGAADPPGEESAIYLVFTRLAWGFGMAWIVFACIYGYGGWVNSILSLGIFQPLGKLSYNVYLIHVTVLVYRCATFRTNVYFDNLNAIFEYSGVLIISHLLSIVMYLFVDAPIAILDRQLFRNVQILPYPLKKKPVVNHNKEIKP